MILSTHPVHILESGYRARFTRFNHRTRVLPRAAGKTWTSVYCTSGSSGFIGYRETGALITFVFQGVQTRGWIRAIHRGRVRNEQTLQLASKLRSPPSFYFRGRLSLTLLRVSRLFLDNADNAEISKWIRIHAQCHVGIITDLHFKSYANTH